MPTRKSGSQREFDGDKGCNTGGMGAYAPAPVFDGSVEFKATENMETHAICGCQSTDSSEACCMSGSIDENGDPFVVEFNVNLATQNVK